MPDPTVVGIDISKTHLDTYMAPAGKAARFTNDSAGFNALIAWIDQPVRSVVYEPTGPWHRAFEEALLQAGLPLARANQYGFILHHKVLWEGEDVDVAVLAGSQACLSFRTAGKSSCQALNDE